MLSLCFRILVADSDLGAEASGTDDCLASAFDFLHKVHPFFGTVYSKCADPELQAQRQAFVQHKNGITSVAGPWLHAPELKACKHRR